MRTENESFVSTSAALTAGFQKLHQDGEVLQKDVAKHLELCSESKEAEKSSDAILRVEELRDRAHSWFNEIAPR